MMSMTAPISSGNSFASRKGSSLSSGSDSSRQTDAQQNLRYDRKLFVQPDKEVRPGDTVTVSRFGRFLDPSPSVQKFEAVGEPLLYQTHREVFLKAVDLA